MSEIPPPLAKGENVTNGKWTGRVLAVSGKWVWVNPELSVDPKKPAVIDGPLTFEAGSISRVGVK